MWIKIGIIVLLFRLEAVSSNVFNTTTCFNGGQEDYSIECKKNGTETSRDIIAVRNVYYGTKLKAPACKQDTCCLPNTTSDCIYRKSDSMEDIIKACSGSTYCLSQIKRLFNFGKCKNPAKYSYFTHYAILEYECINIQKLVNMFDHGITKRDSSLYLTSNIFYNNNQTVNKTCSCVVTTNCNKTIQILAVDVRLAGDVQNSDCYEELVITDGNNIKNITCQDSGLHNQPIFTSNSNIVYINLNTRDKHIGYLWIQVQGTDDESEIEVRCGDNTQLPVNNNHMCEKDTPTTELSTESINLSTTQCADCDQNKQEKQYELSAGTIGGMAAAVILIIVIILVIILVLIFRKTVRIVSWYHWWDGSSSNIQSRRSKNIGSNENIYNAYREEEHHPHETINSPPSQASDGAGVVNPAYDPVKAGKRPCDHPCDNKTFENDMNNNDGL